MSIEREHHIVPDGAAVDRAGNAFVFKAEAPIVAELFLLTGEDDGFSAGGAAFFNETGKEGAADALSLKSRVNGKGEDHLVLAVWVMERSVFKKTVLDPWKIGGAAVDESYGVPVGKSDQKAVGEGGEPLSDGAFGSS